MPLFRRSVLALIALAACGDRPYIELQIADTELPFLVNDRDFDEIRVDVRADECADTAMRFPAVPLPGTATVLAGDCYDDRLSLRASAVLGDRDVARSGWVDAAFPASGAVVVTATLADVPGRRTLFSTGFETGEPSGTLGPLTRVAESGVVDVLARVDTSGALTGEHSAWLTATATAVGARVIARLAVTNVVLARGDELVVTLEIAPDSEVRHIGIDLELATAATAASLGLRERNGRLIAPSIDQGRMIGAREQWVIDLSPAAGVRVVGILVGSEIGNGGALGKLSVRVDDLVLVRP